MGHLEIRIPAEYTEILSDSNLFKSEKAVLPQSGIKPEKSTGQFTYEIRYS